MAAENKMIRVTYFKSSIGYNKTQKATVTAMGFKKLGQTLELKDTPAIRGMIRKVAHMVRVEETK